MPIRLAPSGPRRMGDEYQDIVALHFFAEMLENHNRYDWVKVEAEEGEYLDDVIVKRHEGGLCLYQVKFATEPERDPWTWDMLLNERTGKKGPLPSLLQRWIESYFTCRDQAAQSDRIEEAGLYSNRRLDDAVKAFISDGRLDFVRIPPGDLRTKIVRAARSEDRARQFFAAFRWNVSFPSAEAWEKGIRKRLQELGITDAGWLSLNHALIKWTCERDQPAPDGRITWKHVRDAAEWHTLAALVQEVVLEEANYIRRPTLVSDAIGRVMALDRGGWRIQAPPGFGKSTFLATVYEELKARQVPVIRHHYSLSTTERGGERLSHVRAAESLMNQIEALVKQLQGAIADALRKELERRNPSAADLGRWLDALGAYFKNTGGKLVVIVDGLDHVKRDLNDAAELTSLFRHFRPARTGILFLFGTQPVGPEWLTEALFDLAPDHQCFDLPGLTTDEVRQWVQLRSRAIHLPEGQEPKALVEALLDRSGGHPLILRYMLRALEVAGATADAELVHALPGTPDPEITVYYASLWRSLQEPAREILHLMAACRWEWSAEAILECLDPQGSRPTSVFEGLQGVTHLLVQGEQGLRALHRSLLLFVSELPAHALQLPRLRLLALRWLIDKAPPYLRWQHAWRLQRDVQDAPMGVTAPDWAWLHEALVECYPLDDVIAALSQSCRDALASRDLGRWAYLSFLLALAKTDEHLFLAQPSTLPGSGQGAADIRDFIDRSLSHLPDFRLRDLLALARSAFRFGDEAAVARLLAETEGREVEPFISALPYPDEVPAIAALSSRPLEWMAEHWAALHEEADAAEEVVDTFCSELYVSRRVETARTLLQSQAEGNSMYPTAVLHYHLVPLLVEMGMDVPAGSPVCEPKAALYLILSGNHGQVGHSLLMPDPGDFADDRSVPTLRSLPGIGVMWAFLANILLGRTATNQEWLQQLKPEWSHTHPIHRLHEAALALAPLLTAEGQVDLLPPLLDEGLDIRDTALIGIHLDLLSVRMLTGERVTVTAQQLQRAEAAGLNLRAWTSHYVLKGRRWMDEQALEWLITRLGTTRLAAELTAVHGRTAEARLLAGESAAERQLIRLAASGLDGPLATIHEYVDRIPQAEAWVTAMTPAVQSWIKHRASRYGAGIPVAYTRALLAAGPGLLPGFYRWAVRNGRESAEWIICGLARGMDLTDDVACRLAGTASTDAALYELLDRAEAGESGAEEALHHAHTSVQTLAWRRDFEYEEELDPEERYIEAVVDLGESDPATYPPTASGLKAFLTPAGTDEFRDPLSWVTHWQEQGHGFEAAQAVEESDLPLTPLLARSLFPWLVRRDGAAKAYPALVMAASKNPTFVLRDVHRYYRDRAVELGADALAAPETGPEAAGDLIRYLFETGHDQAARAVGKAIARLCSEVTETSHLPACPWLTQPAAEHWQLEVLLERMADTDGNVAARSILGVAELLSAKDEALHDLTANQLRRWGGSAAGESIAYLPLLVWFLARIENPGLKLPTEEEFSALCRHPSVISQKLRAHLGLARRHLPLHEAGPLPAPPDSFEAHDAWLRGQVANSELRERLRAYWYREEFRLKAERPGLTGPALHASALLAMLPRAVSDGLLTPDQSLAWAATVVPAGLQHHIWDAGSVTCG